MFDLVFGGAQAFQQAGMLIAALVCFGLGALILGRALYQRAFSLRVTGTIIGVIADGRMYAPVYRYVTPDGRTREALSEVSSGSTAGKETGRVVRLLVTPDNPARATQAGYRTVESIANAVGVVLILIALLFGYMALTSYPVTWMTWIMVAAMLILSGWRLHRHVIPKDKRLSIAEWRKQHNLGEDARVDLARVKPIEQLVPPMDLQKAAEQRARQSRRAAPLIGIFAVGLIAVAIYQGARIARLETSGLRADGQVVRLKSEPGAGGHASYYPVVRYRTEKNTQVTFKDAFGSNPPSYRAGDKVTVLYLADDPLNEAIIDRGMLWNGAIPALLLIAAALLIWLMLSLVRKGWRGRAAGLQARSDGLARSAQNARV